MVLGLTTAAGISGIVARRDALLQSNQPPVDPLAGGGFGVEGFTEKGAADTAKAVAGGALAAVGVGLWIAVMIAIFVIDVGMSILPAMLAARCNPKHPFLMGLVGFFFSEIYLFQFLLRKLVINEPGYCKNC